jgi:hypothetical protein
MILEKSKIYQSSFALDFPVGPIPCRIEWRKNRSMKWNGLRWKFSCAPMMDWTESSIFPNG